MIEGHYVACLEDKAHDLSLGVDGEYVGKLLATLHLFNV